MRTSTSVAFILLAGSLASSSFGQIAKSGKGYRFRVKYTVGQTIKLDSSTTISNKGSANAGIVVKAPMTLKVIGISKGLAEINVTVAPSRIQGQTAPLTAQQTVGVKLDDHNRSSSKPALPGVPDYPDNPIAVGSGWKAILPIRNPVSGLIERMDGAYVFSGMKTVDGHLVAVVTFSLSGYANGRGTMLLLAKDGSLFGLDTKVSLRVQGSIDEAHTVVKRIQ